DPGQSFSFKGKRGRPTPGRQAAVILSMDQLVEDYGVACPNYIKIDVPGLTEAIVAGGRRTLGNAGVRELHVECSVTSKGGRRLAAMLDELGFVPSAATVDDGDVTFIRRA